MPGAVDMGSEAAPFRSQFPDGGQGEDLETAAVREDGTVPMLELMQAACLAEGVQTGTEVQMVRVAQDDLRLHILFQVLMIDAFDGAHRAHRHEYGGVDFAMVGRNHARPGGGLGVVGGPYEFEHLISFNPSKLRIFLYFCMMLKQ